MWENVETSISTFCVYALFDHCHFLYSPFAYVDPLHCNMAYLYLELLKDSLNEYAYAAELAGLNYDLQNTVYGMYVSIHSPSPSAASQTVRPKPLSSSDWAIVARAGLGWQVILRHMYGQIGRFYHTGDTVHWNKIKQLWTVTESAVCQWSVVCTVKIFDNLTTHVVNPTHAVWKKYSVFAKTFWPRPGWSSLCSICIFLFILHQSFIPFCSPTSSETLMTT